MNKQFYDSRRFVPAQLSRSLPVSFLGVNHFQTLSVSDAEGFSFDKIGACGAAIQNKNIPQITAGCDRLKNKRTKAHNGTYFIPSMLLAKGRGRGCGGESQNDCRNTESVVV